MTGKSERTASTFAGDRCRFGPPFLVISRHDMRSMRKANMHFITEELAKRGQTRFFSFGFSLLSIIKRDPRLSLWRSANRPEHVDGVEIFLWKTLLHPVNLRYDLFDSLAAKWFAAYVNAAPKLLRTWIASSNTIIFESGFPIIFVRLCQKLNPRAKLLYIASDDLATIGCAKYIIDEFNSIGRSMDGARLPSRLLKNNMPSGTKCYFVPHGVDTSIACFGDPSPYSGGINVVSVGAMLFDPHPFEVLSAAFPQATFHVIGGGASAALLSGKNIINYGEMPFRQTIPYLKHASAGIAPYNGALVSPYLVETSMKLMQFGFLGVPAICPEIVAGCHPGRFGYEPGDQRSIINAMRRAIASAHFASAPVLTWSDVTDRILAPDEYEDTRIEGPAE